MNDIQGEGYGPDDESGGTQTRTTSGGGGTETTVIATTDGPDRRNWGLLLAVGIVAIIFGILVLANIWGSVHLVAILAGLYLVFAGIMQLATMGGARRQRGRIFSGALALVLGLMLILWPEASVKTVAVIVGVAFLAWGVAWTLAALVDRGEGSGVAAAFGVVLAIIGIVVIAWPGPTIAVLMVFVGANALVFGISAIAQALALRKA
jgi:uncharacterized membrane protein HdeD (DUF308 family)